MIVVVPVDPPRAGLVCPTIADQTPLEQSDAARLYRAATADVLRAVAESGGDLLVNYRDEETLPSEFVSEETSAEAAVRSLVSDALGDTTDEEIRLERQVGSTRAARVGNTVTHLLKRESVASVGVLEPTVPLVRRTEIDGAAMSIRRKDVVLGPTLEGETYLAAFSEPIDFDGAYTPPAVATVANRAADAGVGVAFAPMLPTVTTPAGLRSTLAILEARRTAGHSIPAASAGVIDELGLGVDSEGALTRS